MLPPEFMDSSAERRKAAAGAVLLKRGSTPTAVMYVESGRVALGVMEGEVLAHQLGEIQGPFWLEATAAVLGLPSVVDAVAETEVVLRRIPLARFRQSLGAMPVAARTVLQDVATAHRRQTELAVSRLAKDAEARCAEWLLRHAQPGEKGALAVPLEQRKRLIAAQLGIAPETLSRVLRHLRERSLISGTGRVLNLLDPGGLRLLAGV
ncbi:Crp/Fnr family transcriptional regulator [Curvibacter sp. PAE-UM]|uniref:Crp/Fnr family transcriptional regulator n=1 Tax=Curvibacter sp. PAE-UM TaxID=1714344 RepID=UPI000710403E|nr:Crp/Fnr family transcriptional regulator [Curvibacter sp. PAE-UM]KRH98659.1 Crp/Fnr family transcriptional regulator [Curvibacter sp. PAE-UM]